MSEFLLPAVIAVGAILAVVALVVVFRRGRKPRLIGRPLLSPVQASFYHTLREALPGHAVLINVPLSGFIEPAGLSARRSEKQLRELDQQVSDFLICDHQMRPLACIGLDSEPDKATRTSLQAAKIPFLGWRSSALPTRQEIADTIGALRTTVAAAPAAREPVAERVEPGLGVDDLPDFDEGRREPRL
ncbi:DUF2726 domain-containing protein [Methylonatrum kenyense]|uniref:DUF2726 domain-containing protein n=1 Tax=Methylonatrum kenyense TaxID=455253 RepID=UPI0020C07876|nr:DUF2726 domain-containing protein [Methylonatrum kenyense]MCK8515485.1 DUF2726 domain-containing protein [Methylonatrum kenyense]